MVGDCRAVTLSVSHNTATKRLHKPDCIFLDYASLRLLLTQIEAAYEEEDWKRRSEEEEIGNDGREDGRMKDTVWRLRHMLDPFLRNKEADVSNHTNQIQK